MIGEALIGAGLVLLGLVGEDDSRARAVAMAIHLANTFLLLASLALTAWWARVARRPAAALFTTGGWLALLAYVVVGVSGAVTALGDTLFPAASLAEGLAQDLSASAHLLVRLRLHHPWIAVAASLGIAAWIARSGAAGIFTTLVTALLALQLALGAANVLLLAPVWMQLVHLLVADVAWIALVLAADDATQSVSLGETMASAMDTAALPKGPG
jgi:heme A synthase